MPDPYNYSLNIPNPAQSVTQALQLRGVIDEHKAAQQAILDKKQMQTDLNDLSSSPTTAKITSMMLKYPALSEPLKRGHDTLSEDQKNSKIQQATGVYAALISGQNDVAKQELAKQVEAARNSGDEQSANALDTMSQLIDHNPELAKTTSGLFLASLMGPDKFAETFTKFEQNRRDEAKAPAELTEAQAKAYKASVDSQFAESNAALDLQKKGWDIRNIQNDIDVRNQNVKIAALNAGLAKETNDLKRTELQQKLVDAQQERDDKVQAKAAAVQSGYSAIDNTINTADKILQSPALNDVVGSVEGSAAYPSTMAGAMSPFGSSSDDRADVLANIDALKSQTFLAQLQALKNASSTGASGMGSLTEKEGDRLINGLQSLNTRQSEKQFRENLTEVQRLLLKARDSMATKYGVPKGIPDTPAAANAPGSDIDALVKKYSGTP